MIVDQKLGTLDTENIGAIEDFNINVDDPWIYELLSKNVYNNPIEAIIREIYSNAVDASQNGKIEVNLPNEGNNYTFSIKDDGPGMDEEGLKVYTTYGTSTKRNTNESIGGLGIGCKSPFGYTDQFTVESSCNGKKIVMACFKQEDGKPGRTIISTSDTTDHGVKVIVKISPYDLNNFYEAAKRVFLFAKIFPTFDEDSKKWFQTKIMNIEKFIKYREIFKGFVVKRNPLMNGRMYVEMGGVYYRVSSSIFDNTSFSKLFYNSNDKATLILHADIGSLDFQASRESLRETNKTKNELIRLLSDAYQKEIVYFLKNIDEKNYKEALAHSLIFDSYYEKQIVDSEYKELSHKYSDLKNKLFEYFNSYNDYVFVCYEGYKIKKTDYRDFYDRLTSSIEGKRLLITRDSDSNAVPNSLLQTIYENDEYKEVYFTNAFLDNVKENFDKIVSLKEARALYKKDKKEHIKKEILDGNFFKCIGGHRERRYSYNEIKSLYDNKCKIYIIDKDLPFDYRKDRVLNSILKDYAIFTTSKRNLELFDMSINSNIEKDIKNALEEKKESIERQLNSYRGFNFTYLDKIDLDKINNEEVRKDIKSLRTYKSFKGTYVSDYVVEEYMKQYGAKRNAVDLDYKYQNVYDNLSYRADPRAIVAVINEFYPSKPSLEA